MSQLEFQGFLDPQGLQSSPSCSPHLRPFSPPLSPHPRLPFSCPETHRSACLCSTHGAQRGDRMGKREAPPGPGSPLPRPASPKPFAGVGPGASGFCVLHTWRKSQRKPVWNWALCSQGLAGCHGRPIWIVGNRVGLPPAQACFRGSLNISGFYLVVNLSLGKTLPAEGDPMFCPQRRVQPLQLRGGFSLNPMSALSESAVSGTPGRARVCQTLLGAGPWETPDRKSVV